jgi:hypothetical protein
VARCELAIDRIAGQLDRHGRLVRREQSASRTHWKKAVSAESVGVVDVETRAPRNQSNSVADENVFDVGYRERRAHRVRERKVRLESFRNLRRVWRSESGALARASFHK